jgi:hypothetical protein
VIFECAAHSKGKPQSEKGVYHPQKCQICHQFSQRGSTASASCRKVTATIFSQGQLTASLQVKLALTKKPFNYLEGA